MGHETFTVRVAAKRSRPQTSAAASGWSASRVNGWPEAQVRYECFLVQVAVHDADASFEVKLASSGKVVVVARDRTVVQALAEAGIEVPTSCEQGVCGTCHTWVMVGEPDHRDIVLTLAEQQANNQFTPYCSRAKSAMLALDLWES